MKRPKLLVIGVDGFGIEMWFAYQQILEANSRVRCRTLFSTLPLSGPAWTSIYTGMDHEQHGVKDVWGRPLPPDPDRWPHEGSKTFSDIEEQCFWWKMNRIFGYDCAVFNMPMTWPPSEVRPFFVSGMWQRDKPYVFPESLHEKLPGWPEISDAAWWGGAETCRPESWPGGVTALKEVGALQRAAVLTELKAGLFVGMVSSEGGADLACYGFTDPDRMLHNWYAAGSATWDWAPVTLKWIVDSLAFALEPERILVVSDHGMDPDGHTPYGIIAEYVYSDGDHMLDDRMWYTYEVPAYVGKVFGIELPVAGQIAYSPDESAEMERRMKELGYFQ